MQAVAEFVAWVVLWEAAWVELWAAWMIWAS